MARPPQRTATPSSARTSAPKPHHYTGLTLVVGFPVFSAALPWILQIAELTYSRAPDSVWKRHARYARDGTWDRILQVILADADAAGLIDWNVSVDATICRAH